MKTIILSVLTLLAVNMYSQIPDTIYYKPFTFVETVQSLGTSDSQLYILYESKTLPNTLLEFPQPIDKAMTGKEVTDYVFNLIYRYENLNWLDEARIQQRIKSNTLMPTVNKIMQDFTGSGYYPNARQKFISSLQGVYVIRERGNTTPTYMLIRQNGTIVECLQDGQIVENGKTGSIQILTENRFRIISFFGQDVITFNKELDTPFYFTNQIQVKIRKIK